MAPEQLRRREQVESLIRFAAPALNLLLAAGESISRLVEREDVEYYPPRVSAEEAPPPKPPPDAPGG